MSLRRNLENRLVAHLHAIQQIIYVRVTLIPFSLPLSDISLSHCVSTFVVIFLLNNEPKELSKRYHNYMQLLCVTRYLLLLIWYHHFMSSTQEGIPKHIINLTCLWKEIQVVNTEINFSNKTSFIKS